MWEKIACEQEATHMGHLRLCVLTIGEKQPNKIWLFYRVYDVRLFIFNNDRAPREPNIYILGQIYIELVDNAEQKDQKIKKKYQRVS